MRFIVLPPARRVRSRGPESARRGGRGGEHPRARASSRAERPRAWFRTAATSCSSSCPRASYPHSHRSVSSTIADGRNRPLDPGKIQERTTKSERVTAPRAGRRSLQRAELHVDRLRQRDDDVARHLENLRDLVQAELRREQRQQPQFRAREPGGVTFGHHDGSVGVRLWQESVRAPESTPSTRLPVTHMR